MIYHTVVAFLVRHVPWYSWKILTRSILGPLPPSSNHTEHPILFVSNSLDPVAPIRKCVRIKASWHLLYSSAVDIADLASYSAHKMSRAFTDSTVLIQGDGIGVSDAYPLPVKPPKILRPCTSAYGNKQRRLSMSFQPCTELSGLWQPTACKHNMPRCFCAFQRQLAV